MMMNDEQVVPYVIERLTKDNQKRLLQLTKAGREVIQ